MVRDLRMQSRRLLLTVAAASNKVGSQATMRERSLDMSLLLPVVTLCLRHERHARVSLWSKRKRKGHEGCLLNGAQEKMKGYDDKKSHPVDNWLTALRDNNYDGTKPQHKGHSRTTGQNFGELKGTKYGKVEFVTQQRGKKGFWGLSSACFRLKAVSLRKKESQGFYIV